MRHSYVRSLLSVALVGCAATGDGGTFTTADSTAVRATADKWVSTLLAADYNGWGTTVSSDVVMYPPNSKPIVGRDAAIAFVQSYPRITHFTLRVDELGGRGDIAYDRGNFQIAFTLPDGKTGADTGSFMTVFKRQPDGSWPHSRVVWTSHLPPVAPPPPPTAKKK